MHLRRTVTVVLGAVLLATLSAPAAHAAPLTDPHGSVIHPFSRTDGQVINPFSRTNGDVPNPFSRTNGATVDAH